MAFKFFPDTISLLKVDSFEGIVNEIKINGMVNDHSSSCNSYRSKKIHKNIAKNHLQFLPMPTSTTTDAKAWKIFPDTMQLLKSYNEKDL